jgi:hypothetical protein
LHYFLQAKKVLATICKSAHQHILHKMTNNGISNGVIPKTGVQERVNFGKIRLAGHYPDLLEIQLKSFQEFFQMETTPGEPRARRPLQGLQGEFPHHRHPQPVQPGVPRLFHRPRRATASTSA